MNVFILVEGKTERKIYPKWLAHLFGFFIPLSSAFYIFSEFRNSRREYMFIGNYKR